MTKINGNDGMNNFYYGLNQLNVKKSDSTERTVSAAPASAAGSIETSFDFGVGSKQKAEQIKGLEVEGVSKLPQQDLQELNQLAQLAGIKSISVPTQVYDRIGASVADVTTVMTEMETENNAAVLFNSPEFASLNSLFGIV